MTRRPDPWQVPGLFLALGACVGIAFGVVAGEPTPIALRAVIGGALGLIIGSAVEADRSRRSRDAAAKH
jgi:hypothetical protein